MLWIVPPTIDMFWNVKRVQAPKKYQSHVYGIAVVYSRNLF